ncbi:MAG TPA: nickel insertion protein [Myxococcota bacterium]|nr:nickel insertion protein [Myxococcota bacterium]
MASERRTSPRSSTGPKRGRGPSRLAREAVVLLESNLDDMTPEHLAFLLERLHDEGALDASLAPIVMKKGRPGQALRVIAPKALAEKLARLVLCESSALGVRVQEVERFVLPRRVCTLDTEFGPIRVKVAERPDGKVSSKPEYESCARAARKHGVAIAVVTRAAQRRAEDALS